MKPAISQVCTLGSPFELDVAEYSAAACSAIEIWLGKLETYLQTHSRDEVRALLDEHQIVAPVASYQGGLFTADDAARGEHWKHFERRLELCRELQVGTLVVACDVVGASAEEALARVRERVVDAASRAADFEMRLALEFQAGATVVNNLQTAAALIEECAHPNLGLCLDVFHYYLGPSKPEDLQLADAEKLFHVQLCDLLGNPRELAVDADRILPGEGDIRIDQIVSHLRSIEYSGYVSLEVMNPAIWSIPPRQVSEVGITAVRKALGTASME